MSLEDLEKELYAQKSSSRFQPQSSLEKTDNNTGSPIGNPWQNGGDAKKEGSTFSRVSKYGGIIILGLIIAVLILIGFAGFYLYQYFTTKDVSIAFSGPSEIMVGQPFDLSMIFTNLAKKQLASPRISLALPDGVIYPKDPTKRVITYDIGSIDPQTSDNEKFELVVVGKSLTTYEFIGRISYNYEAASLSTRFEKAKNYSLLARDSVILLDFSTPGKILNGEDFEMNLQYQNVGNDRLSGVNIKFNVPATFHLNNSQPPLDNFQMSLESLDSNVSNQVIFSGSVVGQESSFFTIEAKAQIQIGGQYYDINTKSASIAIESSPLVLSLNLDRQNQIVNPGEELSYLINYTNNSDINLSDAVLKVTLDGEFFDLASVSSDGFFNGSERTITWTAANILDLKEIKSRSGGKASFKVKLKNIYPVAKLSDKNYIIRATGQIVSPTVPYNVIASKTVGMAITENKVEGSLKMNQSLYYKEPSADIKNSGPLPPRVGQTTEYTVNWDLAAIAADYKNVSISTFLGPGVKWTGRFTASTQSVPSYNDRTQEVVWKMDSINANQGVIESGPTTVFQISLTPSINQVDSKPVLVGRTTIKAQNPFTEKQIEFTLDPIEIKDISDDFRPDRYDRVQP